MKTVNLHISDFPVLLEKAYSIIGLLLGLFSLSTLSVAQIECPEAYIERSQLKSYVKIDEISGDTIEIIKLNKNGQLLYKLNSEYSPDKNKDVPAERFFLYNPDGSVANYKHKREGKIINTKFKDGSDHYKNPIKATDSELIASQNSSLTFQIDSLVLNILSHHENDFSDSIKLGTETYTLTSSEKKSLLLLTYSDTRIEYKKVSKSYGRYTQRYRGGDLRKYQIPYLIPYVQNYVPVAINQVSKLHTPVRDIHDTLNATFKYDIEQRMTEFSYKIESNDSELTGTTKFNSEGYISTLSEHSIYKKAGEYQTNKEFRFCNGLLSFYTHTSTRTGYYNGEMIESNSQHKIEYSYNSYGDIIASKGFMSWPKYRKWQEAFIYEYY